MTPSERLLRQHQQQQHPQLPSTSHSSEDPLPEYPSHSEPDYKDHWQHPSTQTSQDLTMHRPSHLSSPPDRQQEQQSNHRQHHHPHPPFHHHHQQQQQQHQHQRHEHGQDLPPAANPSQRFETSRGEGTMSTIHSPRGFTGHLAEPSHGRQISPSGPGLHPWPDYHVQRQNSPANSQGQYAQQQNDHSYALMRADNHARFAPSSAYSHHLEREQERELAPPADRAGPGTTDVRLTRHHSGLNSESARLPSVATPPSSVSQDHSAVEARLDRSCASPSPASHAAHMRSGSASGDTKSQQLTAADRHYVLTSRSSASISQQRLSHAVHHPDMSRHEPLQPGLVMSTSPGSEHTTLTSQTSSIEASPTTISSQRNHDHFVLDLMPGREKTPRTPQRIPPPILTKWRGDDSGRDCPPLSFQSNSSQSFSIRSADSKTSPSTPRSSLIHPLMGRPILDHPMHGYDKPFLPTNAVNPPLFLTDSPVGYHEPAHSYAEEHDMEHCSEQDDVRAREHGAGDEYDDDDDDEEENMRATKRVHLDTRGHASVNGFEDGATDPGLSTRSLSARSPKTNFADSPQRDLVKGNKKTSPRTKVQSPRRTIRPLSSQMTTDESSEHMEDGGNGQEGFGAHSLHGKGLGYYAPLLCERVRAKGTTTYNDLVHELAGGQPGEGVEISPQEQSGQGNIRRRVYDALNILESLGIISMDKKAIRWIGIQDSCIIQDATKRVGLQELLPMTEGDRADESEEPEDDDMDIEQLQKEVDALRLQNRLEKAKVEDQIARHVQVNNLIRRNKLAEEKEADRLERRRLRKLEKKAERRAQEGREGSQVPDDEHLARSEKKSLRHTRHRSPRLQLQVDEEEDSCADEPGKAIEDEACMEVESSGDPFMDEEEARRLRKAQRQERRECKERKEKRAQRRQEREAAARIEQERIGLPCVMIRMPGYGAQSSDSEGSIQVVRRVREEPRLRKSHGNKRYPGEAEEEVEMTTTVEVRVSQQDELNVISDTEILGELRLNSVGMNDLQAMLPKKEMMDHVRYSTATTEQLEAAAAAAMSTSEALAASGPQVTVLSGFERQMMNGNQM